MPKAVTNRNFFLIKVVLLNLRYMLYFVIDPSIIDASINFFIFPTLTNSNAARHSSRILRTQDEKWILRD